ncbi:hypothetical protein L596_024425 [Steinernema carpocapsae]|uniref:Uncharacterized protein n=1 Tax=Steinernema carpocapsae TaxID=34508 RepID=A0A4U5MGP7_STECR|nr:hypothetical protein L596_024425 [Steinernema carpocapsae]
MGNPDSFSQMLNAIRSLWDRTPFWAFQQSCSYGLDATTVTTGFRPLAVDEYRIKTRFQTIYLSGKTRRPFLSRSGGGGESVGCSLLWAPSTSTGGRRWPRNGSASTSSSPFVRWSILRRRAIPMHTSRSPIQLGNTTKDLACLLFAVPEIDNIASKSRPPSDVRGWPPRWI